MPHPCHFSRLIAHPSMVMSRHGSGMDTAWAQHGSSMGEAWVAHGSSMGLRIVPTLSVLTCINFNPILKALNRHRIYTSRDKLCAKALKMSKRRSPELTKHGQTTCCRSTRSTTMVTATTHPSTNPRHHQHRHPLTTQAPP